MLPELRDYQEDAIIACRKAFARGRVSPLIVAPTGAGKTRIAVEMVRLHLALGGNNHVLWIAHRKELIEQASAYFDGWTERVVFTTIQTLRARETIHSGITLIIFDEAHHYAADDWSYVMADYPNIPRIGLTATPCRGDGRGLKPAFDDLLEVATIRELTDRGVLVPCELLTPAKPLPTQTLSARPVDAYRQHAEGRMTVVFASCVKDAWKFYEEFSSHSINSCVITGELNEAARSEALRAHIEFGAVLINVNILTEGWDSPSTSCCILARGCNHAGTYLQIVGRILRSAPGKKNALLIDLTGRAISAHGPPTAHRTYHLDGRAIRRKESDTDAFCFLCGAVLDDGYPCDGCGHAPQPLPEIRTRAQPLVRYEKKRQETPEQRAATLANYVTIGRAQKYKPMWALAKYKAVYGTWPTHEVRKLAQQNHGQRLSFRTR